ncbi:MAG: hypothetical protein JWL76_814 [Thermoleophilia bacterium]|nr:hypothetical protein [Thermoleophilia bacterium]
MLERSAPFIALGCGVFAIAIIAAFGWQAWQRWKRVSATQDAAVALVDVHRARLDAAIDLANERVGANADGGEALAASLAELRADARHLQWMLERVPAERERLTRELLDLVLPTPAGGREDA